MTSSTGQCIGVNLKRMREERDHTQYELSRLLARAGLIRSQAWISQLEAGEIKNVSISTLLILCEIYGVPLTEWLRSEDYIKLADHTRERFHPSRVKKLMTTGSVNA